MGRGAIDEDAIRLIEEHNPDIQFDWPRILKQPPEGRPSDSEAQAAPRGRQPERQQSDRRQQPTPRQAPEPASRTEPADTATEESREVAADDVVMPVELAPENREAAVFVRLGPEALARLRARHAEVKARISERQMEEAERDELNARAERLNPDGWVTDADVDEGLEQYEAVYESIRAVVGHARKRRERSAGL